MDRRSAIRNASLILGYGMSASYVGAILSGCQPEVTPGFIPTYFKENQLSAISAFVDTVIPKTDTPSASEVGVVEFLDSMLTHCVKEKDAEMTKMELNKLFGPDVQTAFDKLSPAEQMERVMAMEAATEGDTKKFWPQLKGIILTGYMMSEEIGTNHLAYDPIPGEYNGCIDLSETGGKSWTY